MYGISEISYKKIIELVFTQDISKKELLESIEKEEEKLGKKLKNVFPNFF